MDFIPFPLHWNFYLVSDLGIKKSANEIDGSVWYFFTALIFIREQGVGQ